MSFVTRNISIACLFLSLVSVSQTLRFDNLTTEHGLIADETFSQHQDKDGYLWVFTSYGTLKYDGKQFRQVFKNLSFDQAFMYSIYERKDGKKWVANHKANIYEVRNDSAILIRGIDSISAKLKNTTSEIYQLYVNDSLDIYVITKRFCIKLKKKEQGYEPQDLRRLFNHDSIIYRIIEPGDQPMLIYNFRGVDIPDFFTRQLFTQLKIMGSEKVVSVPVVKQSGLKICKKFGRDIYTVHNTELVRINEKGEVKSIRFKAHINNFTVDKRNHLWVGCLNDGLYELSENDSVISHSLGNITVNDVLVDSQQGIWLSTDSKGLFHCANPDHLYFNETDPLGKPIAFIKMLNNELIIANTMGDIYALQGDKLNTLRLHYDQNEPTDIIATKDQYLVSFRDHLETIYPGNNKQWIVISRSGYGSYGRVLCRLNEDTLISVQRRGFSYIVGKELCSRLEFDKKISSVNRWRDGLLVCTEDGIFEFHGGKIVRPAYLEKTRSINILGGQPDFYGNLWFHSEGYGLFVLNGDNTVKRITIQQGLPSDVVNSITFVKDKNVLLSTNEGLFVSAYSLDPDGLKWHKIFNESVSRAVSYNDKIYLSSKGQLSIIDLSSQLPKSHFYFHLAKVIRDSVEVNQEYLMKLAPCPERMKFEFVFISFQKEKPALSYTLNGSIQETGFSNSYELNFNHMPQGSYTLEVQPRIENGSVFKKTIHFVILPAFYQTIIFRILLLT